MYHGPKPTNILLLLLCIAHTHIHTHLPILSPKELCVGVEIGRGGFSVVNVIESIDLQEAFDTSSDSRGRATLALSTVNPDTGMYRYVIKALRNDLPEEEYSKGIVDLAVEARFLSMLSHPNIVSMRATAITDPLESRFFVILDMLTTTLDVRLQEWRRSVGSAMGVWLGPCIGHCCADREVLQRLWIDRLFVARDIASAIDYLHRQSIVYRDLVSIVIGDIAITMNFRFCTVPLFY